VTKLITAFIVIVVIYCGYHLFVYWEKVKNEEETRQKQATGREINPETLAGLPYNLRDSLAAAQRQGSAATRTWLKQFGPQLQDPRKAWIELDFCEAITREAPNEAKQLFKAVKDRTPQTSPVWKRVKQLEKSYE